MRKMRRRRRGRMCVSVRLRLKSSLPDGQRYKKEGGHNGLWSSRPTWDHSYDCFWLLSRVPSALQPVADCFHQYSCQCNEKERPKQTMKVTIFVMVINLLIAPCSLFSFAGHLLAKIASFVLRLLFFFKVLFFVVVHQKQLLGTRRNDAFRAS